MHRGIHNALALIAFGAAAGWAEAQTFRPPPPVRAPAPVYTPHTYPNGSRGWEGQGEDDGTWLYVALGVIGGTIGLSFLIPYLKNRTAQVRVRITATPPGEAPDHVRQAWIGLEVPLAPGEKGPRMVEGNGVLSGAPAAIAYGYFLDGATAVNLLAAHAPEAAAWWRANAPHVLQSGARLVFPAEGCERLA